LKDFFERVKGAIRGFERVSKLQSFKALKLSEISESLLNKALSD
jgi:hypothetical protein